MLPANKSPRAPFSSSIFISTLRTLSEDEESVVVDYDSQGVEARAASAPAPVPWINKVKDSSCCPQRILTGARCQQAASINQEGRCQGCGGEYQIKRRETPQKGEDIRQGGSCSLQTKHCSMLPACCWGLQINHQKHK